MPSFVWVRDPEEAYQNPYEHDAQRQFVREAKKVLEAFKEYFSKLNLKFPNNDRSLAKAIWMLQVDALEALIDALELNEVKKHRIASRLLRDIFETLDTSHYLYLSQNDKKTLEDWYDNEILTHGKYRRLIKKHQGPEEELKLNETYKAFSKYTHRTFRALNMSYTLGRNDLLVYDGFRETMSLVAGNVISFNFAVVAALIHRFQKTCIETQTIQADVVDKIFSDNLETESASRQFSPY